MQDIIYCLERPEDGLKNLTDQQTSLFAAFYAQGVCFLNI